MTKYGEMTTKQLIEAANDGDRQAIDELEERADRQPVFVEGEGGKLDVDLTLKSFDAFRDYGVVPRRVGPDRKAPKGIREILLAKTVECNPVTGEPLIADPWQDVDRDVRLVVNYGTQYGRPLAQYPEAELLDLALSGDLENKSAYKQARSAYDDASPAEKAQVEQFCFRRQVARPKEPEQASGVDLGSIFDQRGQSVGQQGNYASATGSGAIAQGPGARAAGKGGIAISGDANQVIVSQSGAGGIQTVTAGGQFSQSQKRALHKFVSESMGYEQIRTLCFQMGTSADDLPGQGASAKARELILWAQRHREGDKLVALLKELHRRPWSMSNMDDYF